MFTGLIEDLGVIAAFEAHSTGARLRVNSPLIVSDAKAGDSICVNGVCLTALDIDSTGFSADLAPETLKRTNLSRLSVGSRVNLERSLAAGARLGGHILQGHVDGVGELLELRELGDNNWWIRVLLPEELERYVVFKGSIAIDGISLTLAEVQGREVSVTIIPHTYSHTNLQYRHPGDPVNIETDVIAKYVEKMMSNIQAPR
jgi:riboflavin synthase